MRSANESLVPENRPGNPVTTRLPLDRATYQQLLEHAHFLPIPLPLLHWLLRQALPHSAQAVWLAYLADGWVNGVAGRQGSPSGDRPIKVVSHLSVTRVAAQTGLPAETVRKANRLLVARGLLARTERRPRAQDKAGAPTQRPHRAGSLTSMTEILIDSAACQAWLATPGRRPARAAQGDFGGHPGPASLTDRQPNTGMPSQPAPVIHDESLAQVSTEAIQQAAREPGSSTARVSCEAVQLAARALRARLGEDRYRRLTRIISPRQAAALPPDDQAAYAEILALGERARALDAASGEQRSGRPDRDVAAAHGLTAGAGRAPGHGERIRAIASHSPAQLLTIHQALNTLKRRGAISDPAGLAEEIGFALSQGVFRHKSPRHGLAICLKLITQNRWRTPYGFQRGGQAARGGEGGIALH